MSLAALQGATSAFASSSTTSLPDVGQLRRKYENSGTNTGLVHRGRVRESQPDDEEDYAEIIPPRGRHLSPDDSFFTGGRSVTTITSPSSAGGLDRSPSMIAARLVSANTSPVRGRSAASPPDVPSPGELKTARSPLSASSSHSNKNFKVLSPNRAAQINQSKEAPNLDFEKVPVLSPNSKVTISQEKPWQQQSLNSSNVTQTTTTSANKAHAGSAVPFAIASSPVNIPKAKEPLPAPAPRKARTFARSPLQADLTGPRTAPGLSREEAINRMADAMVASSLASTRATSPTKAGQGRPQVKRSASARASYRFVPTEAPPLPTPAQPIRPMKHTLRKESPDDEEEEDTKRGRRHLVRKHPNMHHEGDRKRWRDKITETERRRYEGVFAANRGLHLRGPDARASPSRLMDPNAESNQVANIVVRDIWGRSRLSAHILEQIYDLVAPDESKRLNREQFVIGLWLIDQKLKGRKLPIKVSDSVWASVRHTHGLNMGQYYSAKEK